MFKLIFLLLGILCFFCSQVSAVNMQNKIMNKELPVYDLSLKKGFKRSVTEDIAKILFYETIDLRNYHNFAIDIMRRKMQVNPNSIYLQGGKEFDIALSEQDIDFLFKVLEDSNIVHWQETYDDADPGLKAAGTGYIWSLAIQYNDGTAWYYSGESIPGNPYLPEGYDILVKGLNDLAERAKERLNHKGFYNDREGYMVKHQLSVLDFENLYTKRYKLEKSLGVQSTNKIAKILFEQINDMRVEQHFAIDVILKKMQVNPSLIHLGGGEEFDIVLSEQDIDFLFKVLEDSNIVYWQETYDDADPGLKAAGTGYIWSLAIQYNDGTAWYYSGESIPGNPYLPEGYDILVKGLNDLAERAKAR